MQDNDVLEVVDWLLTIFVSNLNNQNPTISYSKVTRRIIGRN